MPGERRFHQGLMYGRTRALNRMRELLGEAGVPFPPILNQAGDPMPEADNLGSDGGER